MTREARTIPASRPGGDPICLLTREEALRRRVPPDAFFDRADWRRSDDGYEARLPISDEAWAMASAFIEEEAACCPAFTYEASEEDDAIVVRATLEEVHP